MENLNQVAWFVNRKKFKFQDFKVEDQPFQIMPLTEMLMEDIKSESSYEAMIFLAADSGMSVKRDRIIDDEDMAGDIDCFWELPQNNVECDPSIRLQVGIEVCEISGLAEYVETVRQVEAERKEAEELAQMQADEDEAAKQKVGDHVLDNRDPIDNLNNMSDESLAADSLNNAS